MLIRDRSLAPIFAITSQFIGDLWVRHVGQYLGQRNSNFICTRADHVRKIRYRDQGTPYTIKPEIEAIQRILLYRFDTLRIVLLVSTQVQSSKPRGCIDSGLDVDTEIPYWKEAGQEKLLPISFLACSKIDGERMGDSKLVIRRTLPHCETDIEAQERVRKVCDTHRLRVAITPPAPDLAPSAAIQDVNVLAFSIRQNGIYGLLC